MKSPALALTEALIREPSITPEDAGCQALMMARLEALGFRVTRLDQEEVRNFYAEYGAGEPLLALAGHTDVVPPGDLDAWRTDPFEPVLHDGFLYGRGAADMKTSLAAMIVATERFIEAHPQPVGRLAFLITSDEEGEARHGTRHIAAQLQQAGITPDYCVVGEPSSDRQLGDRIRNGRRGSLNASLRVRGVQGHVAYPQSARNPIHEAAPFLASLATHHYDSGNAHYPPTSLQISSVRAGAGATNIIPGALRAEFNFRYSTEQTAEKLRQTVADLIDRHGLDASIDWHLSGEPFFTPPGPFINRVCAAIAEETGQTPRLSTSGGTSDGRFIAPLGCEVVEVGPVAATIHKVNECVRVADIDRLCGIYLRILTATLGR